MARTRRLPVSLVYAGLFLLVLCGARADTIETSSEHLDKLRPLGENTEVQVNDTLAGKVSSTDDDIATVSPLADDRKSDALSVEELEDIERKQISAAEKAGESLDSQGIKTPIPEGSLTPTATNHTKPEDPPEKTTEKSATSNPDVESNSKPEQTFQTTEEKISNIEDSSRPTRTNDLPNVSAKPVPEESTWSPGDKPEKNEHQEPSDTGRTTVEVTTAKLNTEDEVTGTNWERSLPLKLESASLTSANSESSESSNSEKNLKKEEIELTTTPTDRLEDTRVAKEVIGLESKNSEVQDLEKTRTKTEDWSISLINDTNVNYVPRSNISSTSNSSGPENGTNSIYTDNVSHSRVGPKEEVEVVRNVTQPPVQKIIERTSEPAEVIDPNESESKPRAIEESTLSSNTEDLKPRAEAVKSIEGIKSGEESKLADIGSNPGNQEAEQTTSNQSAIPRGRTIAFSVVNEFPGLESKSTSASKEIDLPSTKKNTSTDKGTEQKPYPYLKSAATQSTPKPSNQEQSASKEADSTVANSTTEESSALENTIVRGDSEKKIVVTEPSVVLENSIQQFKPEPSERSENDSNTSTSQTSASSTTQLLPEAGPTNGTLIVLGGPGDSGNIDHQEKSTSASGNDIPQGGEVITTKDDGFDVTGNGITEVTGRPETLKTDSSRERPFREMNTTTEVPVTTSSSAGVNLSKVGTNLEMQTVAEEAMLIRSTLNASETSTEFPLTKGASESQKMIVTASPNNATTMNLVMDPMTTIMPVIGVNSSESTDTTKSAEIIDARDTNGTNEIPTGLESVTVNHEETLPTTTSDVDYKFMGHTEMTTEPQSVAQMILRENSSEPVSGVLRTTQLPEEVTTMEDAPSTIAPDVTETPSVEIETTVTYEATATTSAITTEESTVASTIPQATPDSKFEDSTALPSYENQTERTATTREEQEFRMSTLTESQTTTEREIFTTVMETESPIGGAEIKGTINMTDSPTTKPGTTWILDVTTVMTTDYTEIASPTPPPPTLPPRVFGPSTPGEPTTKGSDLEPNLTQEEITSLVQIVIQGGWHDVCPKLEELRAVLAELLTSGMNNPVHAGQIIIHQNPCGEAPPSTPTPTDTPLMSILVYVVDAEGKFDSAMTNMLPSLYNSTSMSFPVTEKDSGNAIAVVVVSSVAFICLVLLAGLLFIMRKRQTRFNYGERCRPVSLDAFSLDSVSAYNSVRRKGAVRASKRSYGNPTFEDSPASAATQRDSSGMKQSAIPSHPLNFASLSTFCGDVNAISEEFAGIPQVSAKIDELPAGAEVKNRYANVIPLPETRVPLQKTNNDPLTEYINASYVRGPRNATRYYIACQAPMETTVTDFWRMIWEQQSKVIIMLTDLVENDVEKCTEYIPPSEVTDCHRLYGDFQVTLKKRETKEKYAISTLHLKNLENNTFREVYHIWYLWPVNGVQSDGAGLIAVILEARALQRAGPGPIVVHCSPGTGRTGTLIALDLGIRQYEITRTVDVPRVVYTIRRDRAGAVQTKEQYAFIYKALNLYATKLAGGGGLEST